MILNRKKFFELIELAAKNMGGTCVIAHESKPGVGSVDRILVSGLTKAGSHTGGFFPMGKGYRLAKGDDLPILRRLFGPDRSLWDSCLPGSKKGEQVTIEAKASGKQTLARTPRPSNAEIKELMSNHRPTPNYRGWAQTVALR